MSRSIMLTRRGRGWKAPEVNEARAYDIVRRPIITEKATVIGEHNQYVFEVDRAASKPEIASAVAQLFKVEVKSVNTINQTGKIKRFRGHIGKRKDIKKAIVTLAAGHSIDVTSGL